MSHGLVKGTIMTEVVKFLRSRREEARALVPERLHHYLGTRILSTDWHPEEDYLDLMRAVVQLVPNPGGATGLEIWERAARDSNAAYFEGPYKPLIAGGNPKRSLSRLDTLWRLRHDTGAMVVEVEDDNRARIELRDYALVAEESCALTQGTLWGVLSYSNAKNIEIRHTRCRARGDSICGWQVAWS